jgi:hypothetical protein
MKQQDLVNKLLKASQVIANRQLSNASHIIVEKTVSDALQEWIDLRDVELLRQKIERRKRIINDL